MLNVKNIRDFKTFQVYSSLETKTQEWKLHKEFQNFSSL